MSKRTLPGFGKASGDLGFHYPEGKYVVQIESFEEKERDDNDGITYSFRAKIETVLNNQELADKYSGKGMYFSFMIPDKELVDGSWYERAINKLKNFAIVAGIQSNEGDDFDSAGLVGCKLIAAPYQYLKKSGEVADDYKFYRYTQQ